MKLKNLVLVTSLALAPAGMWAQSNPSINQPGGPHAQPSQGQSAPQNTPPNNPQGQPQSPTQTGSTTPGGNPPPAPTKDDLDKARADAAKNDNEPIPDPGVDLRKNIKKGSEDDVNAAGTRNIGARGVGNWFSTDWEVSNGKQYAMEIERSSHLVTDPVVVEYVNRIGQNLVKNSDAKVPFTIKVLDSDEINAMALPGGFFYVNSGLILACDEEAELAGVMAHEIAHVAAHHAAREMTRMNYMQVASIAPMILLGGYTGYGVYEASQIAVPLTFLSFSRGFEAQADWLGAQYMYRAGYDPQAMVTIFEKLEALEKHKPGILSRAFSDHPATPDRIDHTEEEIATILPARPDYVVTTSEFDDVKERLARIQNRRKPNGKQDPNKPTLRRTNTTNNDPNNPSNSGNDRPTLSRRD